ncbi:MAG: membrane protein insertase YidC [Nitrospiraceae bacterium]|nr:MAG: membrane protein insertase YidC [Nitrospiraceae bacterium]
MEKRTITAVVLSLVILLGWSFLQQKFFPQKPAPSKKAPVEAAAPVPAGPSPAPAPAALPETTAGAASDVVVETDLYKAVFSTGGAVIRSWELKTYKDSKKMPVVLLKAPGVIPPLGMLFEGEDRGMPLKLIYETSAGKLVLSENNKRGELVFTYSSGGMFIRKKFVFYNDDFRTDISIETANTPPYLLPVGTDFGVFDKQQSEHKGPVVLADTDRKEFDEKLKEKIYFTGNTRWIAQEDKYFTAALIPVDQIDGAVVWKEDASAEIALDVKQQKQDFIFYAGPKEYDRLKRLNRGLEHIIDFGWFAFIAMPLFWVLKFFYEYLGNYGWAIILVTIAVRVPFIPILNKSQQSMKKLQKVQPLMNEIKEKYKKDPQRMQKEMMELYKKHKVNPVGGCLPMLLQIPVFIALYNVLGKAIELRGAPFAFWITDLAVKDPYYVLPITMGATMVLQQKMTPSTMDPAQAKIMMFMPVIFTFMFLSFPSGLVLYWLVNNVLGIAQQYYINKKA